MQVNIKFNVGDSIFFMANNKVKQAEIKSANIVINDESTTIKYKVEYENPTKYSYSRTVIKNVLEADVFATQDELLNSLKV